MEFKEHPYGGENELKPDVSSSSSQSHDTRDEKIEKQRQFLKPFAKNSRGRKAFGPKCVPEKVTREEVEGIFLNLVLEYIDNRCVVCVVERFVYI